MRLLHVVSAVLAICTTSLQVLATTSSDPHIPVDLMSDADSIAAPGSRQNDAPRQRPIDHPVRPLSPQIDFWVVVGKATERNPQGITVLELRRRPSPYSIDGVRTTRYLWVSSNPKSDRTQGLRSTGRVKLTGAAEMKSLGIDPTAKHLFHAGVMLTQPVVDIKWLRAQFPPSAEFEDAKDWTLRLLAKLVEENQLAPEEPHMLNHLFHFGPTSPETSAGASNELAPLTWSP